jgi:prolipoprotein diacylglyceryltransferase
VHAGGRAVDEFGVLTPTAFQWLALSAAFWVALALYRRENAADTGRFAVALVLGAAFAHVGWALLHADRIAAEPRAWFWPAGWSVLFVPLGLLAATPWHRGRARREQFLRSSAASLPLALATARLGCLAVGCCHGLPADSAFGFRVGGDAVTRHPTALYDIAGLLLLHNVARWVPPPRAAPVVLGGLGSIRLAIEPWRAEPPLGSPLVPAGWIAALWVAAALAWWAAAAWRRASVTGGEAPGPPRASQQPSALGAPEPVAPDTAKLRFARRQRVS